MSNTGTICTGEGVTMLQLHVVRGALKLEKTGLKCRGGSIRKAWAPILGLKPRDKHDKFLEAIDKKIAECKARLQPGDIRTI